MKSERYVVIWYKNSNRERNYFFYFQTPDQKIFFYKMFLIFNKEFKIEF